MLLSHWIRCSVSSESFNKTIPFAFRPIFSPSPISVCASDCASDAVQQSVHQFVHQMPCISLCISLRISFPHYFCEPPVSFQYEAILCVYICRPLWGHQAARCECVSIVRSFILPGCCFILEVHAVLQYCSWCLIS